MDQTKRPLKISPEFALYAEKHKIFETYKRLLEDLVIEKPTEPIQFMIDQLKSETDEVYKVILIGPPCSGKRTISKMLCNKLKTAHITPDSLIFEADKSLRDEARTYSVENKPLPVELWVKLARSRLNIFDAQRKGWVMEGFPETREQALALQAAGIQPNHFVVLQAPDTVLIERAAGKRVDPKTGDVYHTTFDMPSSSDVLERLMIPENNTEPDNIKKLMAFHRNVPGLKKCFADIYKSINADQPKADVFSHVVQFLGTKARSSAPHNPRIVLLGPTGSGKGVQAALLASRYNIVNVSCGQLVKQQIADETQAGLACKPYVTKGISVPDTLILKVLTDRLSQLDCVSRGWVLHGYPHTRDQGEQLSDAGFVPNRVFFLDVPNDSVIERLTKRATDPVTGRRFHLLYNPPPNQEVNDRLQVAQKDYEAEVRKRLSQFSPYAEELSDYYELAQHVNADQDPHTVFEALESMIVHPLPKKIEIF